MAPGARPTEGFELTPIISRADLGAGRANPEIGVESVRCARVTPGQKSQEGFEHSPITSTRSEHMSDVKTLLSGASLLTQC